MLARRLVLKGGSALDLAYGLSYRASIDLDLSIAGDFTEAELSGMPSLMQRVLEAAFRPRGVRVFDLEFSPRPERVSADLAGFWGGYSLCFKLIDANHCESIPVTDWAREAMVVGPAQRRTLEVDISRFECCDDADEVVIAGRAVRAYSPRLMVCEKLRAICQQMPEYRATVKRPHGSARARDFFDIRELVVQFTIVVTTPRFRNVLARVFAAKRVPIALLWRIEEAREMHRADFASVQATIQAGVIVASYDEYVDFVVARVAELQATWDVQAP